MTYYVSRMLTIPTNSDGIRGTIRYRDFPIEGLFHEYVYEDIMHLIIWGSIPTQQQKDHVREAMSNAMKPPQSVKDVILSFPYGHPPPFHSTDEARNVT